MNDETPQTEEFERRIREAASERVLPELGRAHASMLLAAAAKTPPTVAIDDVLEERHTTHGDFHQDARIAQALKHVIRQGINWDDLTPEMKECADHSMTKWARILAGDFRHPGHWEDLIGYPTLVRRSLD